MQAVVEREKARTLLASAEARLARRDTAGALDLLRQAEAADPTLVEAPLNRALALRMQGDHPAAVAALDAVLALEPRHFLALLSKGALLEKLDEPRAAASAYRAAVTTAPPDDRLPAPVAGALARAREAVREEADAAAAFLHARLLDLRGARPAGDRFDEALEIYAGRRRAYVQEPLLLNYPRLPAIAWHDRADFPWLAELEAATDVIRGEMEALDVQVDGFAPYIAYPKGAPVNQWGELNHSRRWSSFFLWRDGVRQEGACASCPRTAALLETLPMQDQPGFAPTAMFSTLAPRTHIPAHTGSANTRLLVHLPLVLPGPARFRVGGETRAWRMGEAWVFDDTIEHEAWNDADAHRTILIFDVWNPALSLEERTLIGAMMTARNDFQAGAAA